MKYSHQIKLKPPDLHSAWSSLQSPYKMQYPNIGKYKEILKSQFNPNTYLLFKARDYHQKQLNKINRTLSNFKIPTIRKKHVKNPILLKRNVTILNQYHKYRHDGKSPLRAKTLLSKKYKLSISYIDDIVKRKKNTI